MLYVECAICNEMVLALEPDSLAKAIPNPEEHQHVKITFTYAANLELGPQPEDISIHYVNNPQSARNLLSYNLTNKGLISINTEFDVPEGM